MLVRLEQPLKVALLIIVIPLGMLMEVKFDDFLPDEIYSLLQLDGLSASTFSKYYLCRKFKG